jgi:hypothetical protein
MNLDNQPFVGEAVPLRYHLESTLPNEGPGLSRAVRREPPVRAPGSLTKEMWGTPPW